jgi:3-phytase
VVERRQRLGGKQLPGHSQHGADCLLISAREVETEDQGIWRLDAAPDASDVPVLVHDVASGQLHADVEGLTIYPSGDRGGYLIASSQGSSSYVVYERGGDNAYVTSFRIVAGTTDAAVESDGIEVTNVPLGPLWPDGLFIAHDDHNEDFTRNFKLVGWGDIAAAADVELLVDLGG